MKESPPIQGLRFLLPLDNELRWSDMLATVLATDPRPFCDALGLDVEAAALRVDREVQVEHGRRADLVLRIHDRPIAVVEVKVLSGLGVASRDVV